MSTRRPLSRLVFFTRSYTLNCCFWAVLELLGGSKTTLPVLPYFPPNMYEGSLARCDGRQFLLYLTLDSATSSRLVHHPGNQVVRWSGGPGGVPLMPWLKVQQRKGIRLRWGNLRWGLRRQMGTESVHVCGRADSPPLHLSHSPPLHKRVSMCVGGVTLHLSLSFVGVGR